MITRRPSITSRNYNASAKKPHQDSSFQNNYAKPFANHQNSENYKSSYGTPVKPTRNPIGTIKNYDDKQTKCQQIQTKYQDMQSKNYPSSNFKYSQNQDPRSHYLQLTQISSTRIPLQKLGQNQQRVSYNHFSQKNHSKFVQKVPQNNLQKYPFNEKPTGRISNDDISFDKLQCQKPQIIRQNKYENCYSNDRRQLSDITGKKINLASQKNTENKQWGPRQSQVEKTNFLRSRQNRKQFLKQAQEKLQCYNQQFQSGTSNNNYFMQERKQDNARIGFNQTKVPYKNIQQSIRRQYTPQKLKKGDGQVQQSISYAKRSINGFPQNNQYSKMTPREKSAVLRQQLQKSRNVTAKGYNFHNPLNPSKQMNRSVDQISLKNALNFENQKHEQKPSSQMSNQKLSALFKMKESQKQKMNESNAFVGVPKQQKINDIGLNKSISNSFCANRHKGVDYGENSFMSVFQKGLGVQNEKTIGKLKKINELNQKINQRIKKIIDNFENKSL